MRIYTCLRWLLRLLVHWCSDTRSCAAVMLRSGSDALKAVVVQELVLETLLRFHVHILLRGAVLRLLETWVHQVAV